MSFFGQPQQSPAMFQGGQSPQLPPQIMQMLMQMHQGGGMQTPQIPPNIPQQGLMPSQMPMAGAGPSQGMNPLASILGNQGGAMSPQGGMNNGSAMGGDGAQGQSSMGGIMQIINAMKAAKQVNGTQPPQGMGGGIDLASIIRGMGGMGGGGDI